MLTRAEYRALLEEAGKVKDEPAPVGSLLVSADYDISIADGRATVEGDLKLQVLEKGLQALALALGGVGLRNAVLDDAGAAIGRADDGGLTLFVDGEGRHRLTMEIVAPLETTAARQVLKMTLPVAPATRCRLSVPGDVEVQSGAAVVSRRFDESRELTHFELLLRPGPLELVLSLNSRLKRRDRVVTVNSVIVDEITEFYERLHGTLSLRVLHRPLNQFTFRLPEGFETTKVSSPRLSRWEIVEGDSGRLLSVRLREEVTGTEVLTLTAGRSNPDLDQWQMPRFEPVEAAGQASVIGIVLEDRLKIRNVVASGMVPLDTSVLSRAIPRKILEPRPGGSAIRPVLAYFAPDGGFDLRARLARAEAKLKVTTNVLLLLEDGGLEVQGGFTVMPRAEKLFGLSFLVPRSWEVKSVTGAGGSPLAFERYEARGDGSRILVRLPVGLNPGEERQVFFTALHTPPSWFEPWQSRSVSFPLFRALDASEDAGALAVAAGDDMIASPVKIQGLTPLDETEKAGFGLGGTGTSLAYRYDGHPYEAELTVERRAPQVTAETFSFLRMDKDALHAHYEVIYTVDRARVR
jgi:hypothetical protein